MMLISSKKTYQPTLAAIIELSNIKKRKTLTFKTVCSTIKKRQVLMCPMGPFKFGARFPKFVFIQPLDPMQQLQKLFQ